MKLHWLKLAMPCTLEIREVKDYAGQPLIFNQGSFSRRCVTDTALAHPQVKKYIAQRMLEEVNRDGTAVTSPAAAPAPTPVSAPAPKKPAAKKPVPKATPKPAPKPAPAPAEVPAPASVDTEPAPPSDEPAPPSDEHVPEEKSKRRRRRSKK